MYITNDAILSDAYATDRLRTQLLGEMAVAQIEAERSLASARAYFLEAADVASLMVEASSQEELARRREESLWKQSEAVGHRSDAFIALGEYLDKYTELKVALGIHDDEEE